MSAVVDIEKSYGSFRLKVRFQAKDETMALLGASGCGKSLTLKCIAGIEKPDRGHIEVDGITLFDSDKHINLTPQQRKTGLMFQNYALFPNMTVLENIRSGALREKDRTKREQTVSHYIELLGLGALVGHYPSQLSGGQQQRTALARILVSDPRILLLDEPFSALDSHLRFRLEQELRRVIRGFGRTVILVSHDRDEVFRLSDSVAVMENGHIETVGEKRQVYSEPRTRAAAMLTGCKNISTALRLSAHRVSALDWGIELDTAVDVGDVESVGIRMNDIRPCAGDNSFVCRVLEEIENPFSVTLVLSACDKAQPLCMELSKAEWNEMRSELVTVSVPRESVLLLKGENI